jgi:hypothetical protein
VKAGDKDRTQALSEDKIAHAGSVTCLPAGARTLPPVYACRAAAIKPPAKLACNAPKIRARRDRA